MSGPVASTGEGWRRRRLLLGAALLGVVGRGVASSPRVWLVPSDTGSANEEAATAVREGLAAMAAVEQTGWEAGVVAGSGADRDAPRVIVTLGTAALRGMMARRAREPALAAVPLVAGLVPRHAIEAEVPSGSRQVAVIALDQPVERYGELVRQAMPQRRRLGLLVGTPVAGSVEALQRWAARAGRDLQIEPVRSEGLAPALRRVLETADVLLAVPDPAIFTPEALQNILIASYRRRVPVVSYAPAHVRAGAVLALAVTPAQAGRQIAEAARAALQGRALPALALARDFAVAVNEPVARSLELVLPTAAALEAALRQADRQEGRG
ncbi:hypothetical protein A9O67_05050 [Tepidimonas fonticaldi]|uniref:ABC transporter substrate-binding protein n=1 Tax=Tepidimonas fonticaldi TaxID=1101373 RepID=A0A1A6DUD5_9BURK|nr:ABC transporter substrate binding protein [Tepidimonas fonticaldi]OBS30405.1 hypothetical protein A9O67_05050 [Tepidimonas fonticaldi]